MKFTRKFPSVYNLTLLEEGGYNTFSNTYRLIVHANFKIDTFAQNLGALSIYCYLAHFDQYQMTNVAIETMYSAWQKSNHSCTVLRSKATEFLKNLYNLKCNCVNHPSTLKTCNKSCS